MRRSMTCDMTSTWHSVWNRVAYIRTRTDFRSKSVEAALGYVLCEQIDELQEQIDELKKDTWWTKIKRLIKRREHTNITTLDSSKKLKRMNP